MGDGLEVDGGAMKVVNAELKHINKRRKRNYA
jgi:hypothetical protein